MTADPGDVARMTELSAVNIASDTARAWLDAPRPAPDATGPYAMSWYCAWLRILLLDLAVFPGVVLTHQGVADVLKLPSVSMVQVLLDQLRRNDEEEPALTERDYARVAKAH